MTNYANARNYIRSDDNKVAPDNHNISFLNWSGNLERFKSAMDTTDYTQCNDHYMSMTPKLRKNFVTNVVASLSTARIIPTQQRSLGE